MHNENKNILIIDDDPNARKLISHFLLKKGYNIFEAENSKNGYNVLNEHNIDLVFCDVMMSEMDGFEFCEKVRANEKYKALPFIFITAKISADDRARAFNLGADDFITKPFSFDDLLLKTEAILKRIEIYRAYGIKKNIEYSLENELSKILIVDDDIISTKLLSFTFKQNGFDCISANDAATGYKLAKSFVPDIILSDLMMPDIGGFEFRRMLTEDAVTKNIPFVFLTGNDSENIALEGYDLDIKDFILKSTKPEVIAAKIRNILKSINKERQSAISELQQAAGSISIEVVPDNPPEFEGFEITQWHESYKGVPGGDFIDYVQMDDDNLAIILGDVMGKKWGAWFFSFAFISYFRSAIRYVIKNSELISADEILYKVNEVIFSDTKISKLFSTVSVLIINKKDKTAQYSGAGDLPLICFNDITNTVQQFLSEGILLGMNENGEYNNTIINLNKGDNLILYTDGITETRDSNDLEFGISGLVISMGNLRKSENIIEKIKSEFMSFSENKFGDDVSLISVKCL